MKAVWKITIQDYLNIIEIARNNNKKPGESMEKEFLAYMKEKNCKPMGHTELNKEELLKEYASHDKSVMDIETDSKGKNKYTFFKKRKT